jgi:hydroxypyruvate reductase
MRKTLEKLLEVAEPERVAQRKLALEVAEAALAAVEPGAAIRHVLHYEPLSQSLSVAGQVYNLKDYQRIVVVGAGKASAPMAATLYAILGDRISAGAINIKYGYGLADNVSVGPIVLQEAGHPVLDQAGLAGTRHITELLQPLTAEDLVIAVISGGASALLELPVAGVSLADMQVLTEALLRAGATINQFNAVRKHLSQVKGGNLARLAAPATMIGLIVSDVVGSPLDVIGSGPGAPDTSTFATAWQVLETFNLTRGSSPLPATILTHLQKGLAGEVAETPKPNDSLFAKVQNVIVADNRVAALAAVAKAGELGLNPLLLSTFIEGEAREVARSLAGMAKEVLTYGTPLAPPACILVGGETTVTVHGSGKGGRNQELALAAALALAGYTDFMVLALATDGTDGPTDAAGAICDAATLAQAQALGLDAHAFLRNNDAYHFFEQLGDLLLTGPTNTNVNDLTMLFCF